MEGKDEKIKILSEFQSDKLLGKEVFRKRVIEIICEYIENINFVNVIKKYSREEMDRRLLYNIRYWLIVIVTSIITSLIGLSVGLIKF